MSTIFRLYLPHGTDHSSCICKAEFCYVCAKTWKNCNCPLFNHPEELPNNAGARRFVFRAERAFERYEKHLMQTWGMLDPRSREEQIQEIRDEVENGCDHGYWDLVLKSRKDPGHCKLCKYVGHRFIFQCLNCPLTSCYACHTDAPPEYRREEQQQE